jgi:hypothetical protein
MSDIDWRAWPALSRLGTKRHWRIIAEQALLGFAPGATEPEHRAVSPGFGDAGTWLAELPWLGDAALPAPALVWQRSGSRSLAGAILPRAGGPQAGRKLWLLCHDDAVGVPPALLALVLLDRVQTLAKGAQPVGSDVGAAAASAAPSVLDMSVREALVAERIAAGCQALAQAMGVDELRDVYAALLAGNRIVALPASVATLSGAGCAAMLLPLAPELADGLGLCTRSSLRGADAAARQALGSSGPHLLGPAAAGSLELAPEYAPSSAHATMARVMAEALLSNDLKRLRQSAAPASARDRSARVLRLWGGPSSGKSAYLGLLATKVAQDHSSAWEVLPGHDIDPVWFASQLRGFDTDCRFPQMTSSGDARKLGYVLRHRTDGRRARVEFEDRAGADYVNMSEKVADQLTAADGIMLLLDPLRPDWTVQENEVQCGLKSLQRSRGTEAADPRPLALCCSKCDALIADADDYRRALDDPEGFLSPHIGHAVIHAVRRQFPNMRMFAVSAAGVRLMAGVAMPAVFYDEALELRIRRDGMPLNLLEPLTWLLEAAVAD